MEIIIVSFEKILLAMPNFVILLIGLLIARYSFIVTTKFDFNQELTVKDNPAIGIVLSGYLIGAGFAISGSIFGAEVLNLMEMAQVGGIIILTLILMRISVALNDLAILHSFRLSKELSDDQNSGAGFVVAGSCIATGLMLNGVLSGSSPTYLIGLRDIIIYWTLGQLILITGGFVFQLITKYDAHHVIGVEDNMPAGMSFGGFLFGLGIIVQNSLRGAGSRLGEEILVTIVFAVFGLIILILTRTIVDKIFLPGSPLTKEVVKDRNPAAGVLAAVSFIVVALLFTAAINPNPAL